MPTLFAPLAQLVEQLTLNQWVPGSSPWWCTIRPLGQAAKTSASHAENRSSILLGVTILYSSLAQLVEHAAVNRRVVGSSPTGGAISEWIFVPFRFFIIVFTALSLYYLTWYNICYSISWIYFEKQLQKCYFYKNKYLANPVKAGDAKLKGLRLMTWQPVAAIIHTVYLFCALLF